MSQSVMFKDLAREWWETHMLAGDADYARESWRRLQREVMPTLGNKPVKKITAPMILEILRHIEVRDTLSTRDKVKSHVSQVMRYGIASGIILNNPARDLGFALKKRSRSPGWP